MKSCRIILYKINKKKGCNMKNLRNKSHTSK
nr:MAG TPA: hypothetical protein [Caudoviricetes sp.]